MHVSTMEILAELQNLSSADRRKILDRILEMEENTQTVEAIRRTADAAFLMLDTMEAEDAANDSR